MKNYTGPTPRTLTDIGQHADTPTRTAAQEHIANLIAESLAEDTTPDMTPWQWWEVPITADTRRAAWDIDTGRHSGLCLIADLEGVEVMLEVVAMEVL